MNVYAREPFDTDTELSAQDPWRGFLPGTWTREIDVRSFIIANVTPFEGDASFLAGITPRTADLWERLKVHLKAERDKGGVLDVDVSTPPPSPRTRPATSPRTSSRSSACRPMRR